MCRLQAGDKVLTVNGHQVAEMSYTDWKSCIDEALQEGSLVMDIRRHGKNSKLSARVCVCVCVRARNWKWMKQFKCYVPGLTVLLMLLASLNSFDTLNWSINCCEIIHEWYHDSQTVKDGSFFFLFFSCFDLNYSFFSPFCFSCFILSIFLSFPSMSHQHSSLCPYSVSLVVN